MFRWLSRTKDDASSMSATVQKTDQEQSINRLRESIENQEKREMHLQNKIYEVIEEAKTRSRNGDKRGALFSMKKKKLYENEMEKIQNVKMTLETQIFHVESSVYNSATISAMSQGTKTMKKIHAQTGVEKVEDLLDEIREEAEIGQELSNAFRQPLDFMMDDDELLAELGALSSTASIQSPTPLSMPSAPIKKYKLQGKHKDDEDLKRLEEALLA